MNGYVAVSEVLYSDKQARELMEAECQRVAAIGGRFTLHQYFSTNWFVRYEITYPEQEQTK